MREDDEGIHVPLARLRLLGPQLPEPGDLPAEAEEADEGSAGAMAPR